MTGAKTEVVNGVRGLFVDADALPDVVMVNGERFIPDAQRNVVLVMAKEALRLTREYVGEDMLPAIKGWSWYDATVAIDEYLGEVADPDGRIPTETLNPGCPVCEGE